MSPYKTSEGFNTALGAGLNSTWSGADAIHGVVNAGVRMEGAVAEHQVYVSILVIQLINQFDG